MNAIDRLKAETLQENYEEYLNSLESTTLSPSTDAAVELSLSYEELIASSYDDTMTKFTTSFKEFLKDLDR